MDSDDDFLLGGGFSDDDDDYDLEARYGVGEGAGALEDDIFEDNAPEQHGAGAGDGPGMVQRTVSEGSTGAPQADAPDWSSLGQNGQGILDQKGVIAGHAATTALVPMSSGASGSRGVEYRIISATDIMHEQRELVAEVSEMFTLPKSASMALLLWAGWSKEMLVEKYRGKEIGRIRTEAGVTELIRTTKDGLVPSPPPTTETTCEICYQAYPTHQMAGLSCQHRFCRGCWKGYLHDRVGGGSTCIFTVCPMAGCSEVCTQDTFRTFCGPMEFLTYEKFLTESYVDINSRIRWCPGKGCEKAIAATCTGVRDVKCVCGTEFCFRCQEEAHFPLTCTEKDSWSERCDKESGAANWILENTKKCPKCSTRIEKSSGCNKIQCNTAGCGHAFCWVCLGPWSEHGNGNYYNCNKFVKKGSSKVSKRSKAGARSGAGGGNKENRGGTGSNSEASGGGGGLRTIASYIFSNASLCTIKRKSSQKSTWRRPLPGCDGCVLMGVHRPTWTVGISISMQPALWFAAGGY